MGNTMDQENAAAILADAQQRHAAAVASPSGQRWKNFAPPGRPISWLTLHCLRSLAGCCASGTTTRKNSCRSTTAARASESAILGRFWATYLKVKNEGRPMVGLNIFDFDLPFLARRSWINGIDVPETAIDQSFRYWDRVFVDLRRRWLLGQHSTSCKSNSR